MLSLSAAADPIWCDFRKVTRTTLKWFSSLLALLVLIVAARSFPVAENLREMLAWTRSLGYAGVVVYALAYALAAMLCVPCLPLTIGAGVLFGPAFGLVAVVGGSGMAATGGFLMARYTHRGRVAQLVGKRRKFRVIDKAIGREGWKIVFLLRMVLVPFGLSNYIYGITRVEFWHYLLATLVGMLPGNVLFVYLGSLGMDTLTDAKNVHPVQYVLLALAVFGLAGASYVIKKKVMADSNTQ